MIESGHLRDVLIILAAAVAIVPLFRRLGVSAVLGYLAAGALIGPSALNLIRDVEGTEVLAELGVVFLLFAVGLELSVERLIALRRQVFGLGTAQVVVTACAIWAGARLLGMEGGAAVVVAGGLALSSTAVVLQMLAERQELFSRHGRVVFSVLLLQDLAVVPLLVLVPLLGEEGTGVLAALGSAMLRAVLVLAAIVAAGRLLLRPMLRAVAHGRNSELFTGITLLLVLGVGWITMQAGLSMPMGAFLAGLLISETEFRPQVEADIEPFRGTLLALFFMTVGMGIDLGLAVERAGSLLALVAGLLLLKAVVIAALCRAFGLAPGVAARVGITLAQGGEFGFVLFALAARSGVIPVEVEQTALLVVSLSMALTPLLLLLARRVGERLARPTDASDALARETAELHGHVLIAGFGRVGQTLAGLLDARRVPYVALDLDAERVAMLRARGLSVYFGDASRAEVLRAGGVERARVAVVTLDQPAAAHRAVHQLRQLLPELPILARARDVDGCLGLERSGATRVVPEIVEGSLQLGAVLLHTLGEPDEEIADVLDGFRREAYAELSQLVAGSQPAARPGRQAAEGARHFRPPNE